MLLKQKKYRFSDMLMMSFKTSPFYSIIFALKYMIDALLPTCSIFITANFLNTAVSIYSKESEISSVYTPVVLLGGIIFYNALIDIFMSWIDCNRNIFFRRKLVPDILLKRTRLKYYYMENSKTADLINRVCQSFDKNVWDMYLLILNVTNLVVFIFGIIITLFTQVRWIAVTMIIASIPIIYIATKAGKQSYEADKEVTKIERWVNYISNILKSREAFEERNIYGYSQKLNDQFLRKYEYSRKCRLKVKGWNLIKSKFGGVIITIYSIGAMFSLTPAVMSGSLTIGMFISLIAAILQLTRRLSWGINAMIQDLSHKSEYLKELTEFMMLEEDFNAEAKPKKNMKFNVIEFVNVRFRYPGTEKIILDGVSFTIKCGKHYSFVGINGAGKTTITKLITGLYDKFEGDIRIDGRSIRNFTQSEIKGLSSVVYQDFAKYSITLYDNIAIADFDNIDNLKNVENAVDVVGLSDTVLNLPNGLHTPLGKITEGGVDVSIGEWQRIAMARSIVSPAPLKILDEPTAALDPIGESMLYHKFEKISKGLTTISISHRLGSTQLADVIYVLSNGIIIESGSHSTLMAHKSVYYDMFKSQAKWYDIEDEYER